MMLGDDRAVAATHVMGTPAWRRPGPSARLSPPATPALGLVHRLVRAAHQLGRMVAVARDSAMPMLAEMAS